MSIKQEIGSNKFCNISIKNKCARKTKILRHIKKFAKLSNTRITGANSHLNYNMLSDHVTIAPNTQVSNAEYNTNLTKCDNNELTISDCCTSSNLSSVSDKEQIFIVNNNINNNNNNNNNHNSDNHNNNNNSEEVIPSILSMLNKFPKIKVSPSNEGKVNSLENTISGSNSCIQNEIKINSNIKINQNLLHINSETEAQQENQSNISGSCSNYRRIWKTKSDGKINVDDLKELIEELKHRIEYTERMNWLCLSRRPIGPPQRKSSLPKHTEVKRRFLQICDTTLSNEIKAALRLPEFDSYQWEDEDILHFLQVMFVEANLVNRFNIPLPTLREWLYEVYKHYNAVPFHNFRHCFCVAQMMYTIAYHTNLSEYLGDLEILILLVSCICHDLDHPGYNNIYQINARTELALRYNDISPLENHHCSIAFRLLEHPDCNIFKNFSKEKFKEIREGIIRCILATDMARHNEILIQFKEISSHFDFTNRSHVNLLCMILIKVADISNEARPMDIAEPWLERLLQEFFAQSAAEKSEGLPVTPFMDPDKVSKPGSQVRFIGLVLLPLFEALGELLPQINDLIIHPVRVALNYYKQLNDIQTRSRKSVAELDAQSENGTGSGNFSGCCSSTGAVTVSPQLPRSHSGISVRSRRSIPSQKSTSRTSVDEPTAVSIELHDLPEDIESGDSETATEVEVAEKTSKFKVDTEGNNRNKCSQPSSRKGSREKRPSMISELCTSGSGGRIRNSYGNIYNTNIINNNNIHHQHHLIFLQHQYGSATRLHYGSNRAYSLDQYSSMDNRRLSSDSGGGIGIGVGVSYGLQQVTSDNSMYYNISHRSLDNETSPTLPSRNLKKLANEKVTPSDSHNTSVIINKVKSFPLSSVDLKNKNKVNSPKTPITSKSKTTKVTSNLIQTVSTNTLSTTMITSSNNNNGTKSFISRLRQLTGRFGFNFEKDSKQTTNPFGVVVGISGSCESIKKMPVSNSRKIIKNTGFDVELDTCSTLESNLPQPFNDNTKNEFSLPNLHRNRAYSLDVPPSTEAVVTLITKPHYSSCNTAGHGDNGNIDSSISRQSSKGHESNCVLEDNNSNYTVGHDTMKCTYGLAATNLGIDSENNI